MRAWIGVDFDGTLATYEKWEGPTTVGQPIPEMVERVKQWLEEGEEVRIFTARVYPLLFVPHSYTDGWENSSPSFMSYETMTAKESVKAIRAWCLQHIGRYLAITCVKDYGLKALWDDRAIRIITNTGKRCCV